jgi:membrane fusion protein (multidrug efflux system)
VHQTLVTTGRTRGDQVQVLAGLAAGDTIVTSGQIKLHDGSAIAVNNTVQPADGAAPHPVEE